MKYLAWLLAFGAGFLSLSQEILWVRLISFWQQGVPHAFSYVLFCYLVGIALGASLGKRICSHCNNLATTAGFVLLASGILDLVLTEVLICVASLNPVLKWLALTFLIMLTATLKAILFPVAHHLGSSTDSAHLGRSLSWVYFFNIAGSTLGPLLVGFVLLDYMTLEAGLRWIGTVSVALATVALLVKHPSWSLGTVTLLVIVGFWAIPLTTTAVIHAYAAHDDTRAIKHIVSNRHGLLHVTDGGDLGDMVFGGNVYDGRTNTELTINSNRIDRVYLLAALHPEPKNVLVIGLSTGAWTRVLAEIPSVRKIDVIEINPGYLSIISRYPHLASLLKNPKINIFIDDGRRWLNRNNNKQYDLIVMNTTFHWRANVTNLLSNQFMQLVKSHLTAGGIFAFNATGSDDAFATAHQTFSYAYRWSNFVYAAEHDFRFEKNKPEAFDRLIQLRNLNTGPSKNRNDASNYISAVTSMLSKTFLTLEDVQLETPRPLEVIDDLGMQSEFKYGRGFQLR